MSKPSSTTTSFGAETCSICGRVSRACTLNCTSTICRQVSVRFSQISRTTASMTFCSISVSARVSERPRPVPPSIRSIIVNATFGFSSSAQRPSSGWTPTA